jgi:hypothetical protein
MGVVRVGRLRLAALSLVATAACGGRIAGSDEGASSGAASRVSTSTSTAGVTSRGTSTSSSTGAIPPTPAPTDGGVCPPGVVEITMEVASSAQYCAVVAGPYGTPSSFFVEDTQGTILFQPKAQFSCDSCALGGNYFDVVDLSLVNSSSDLLIDWKGTQQVPGTCGPQGTSCVSAACASPQKLVAHLCAWPDCASVFDGIPKGPPTCVDVPFEYPAGGRVVGYLP